MAGTGQGWVGGVSSCLWTEGRPQSPEPETGEPAPAAQVPLRLCTLAPTPHPPEPAGSAPARRVASVFQGAISKTEEKIRP